MRENLDVVVVVVAVVVSLKSEAITFHREMLDLALENDREW